MDSMKMMAWIGLICLCFIVILIVVAGAAYYMMCCMRWRNRIVEIRDGRTVYLGWNLKRLKETVTDLEYERVDRMELIF